MRSNDTTDDSFPTPPPIEGEASAADLTADLRARTGPRLQTLGLILLVLGLAALGLRLLAPGTVGIPLLLPGALGDVPGPERIARLQLGTLAMLGAALFAVARYGGLGAEALRRVGLFYELLVAFLVATLTLLARTHAGDEADLAWMHGPTFVGLWVLIFPLVVHVGPWTALVTGLVAVSFEPLLLTLHQWRAPDLEPALLGNALDSTGNLLCALLAVLPARRSTDLFGRLADERRRTRLRLRERIGDDDIGGETWTADHPHGVRPLLVRVLRPERLGRTEDEREERARELVGRVRAAAGLQSPHTDRPLDVGLASDGTLHVVSERFDGIDAAELVRRHGPLPSERAAYLLGQVCHALHDAHVHGVLHLDLGPSRILVCRLGIEWDFVKVRGFGLARPLVRGVEDEDDATPAPVGTPAWMAPEVAGGGSPDPRSDVYAVGCLATWLTSGREVFEGSSLEVIAAHLRDKPEPPSRRGGVAVDPDLERIVMACLEKDPADRPADARALGRMLATTGLASRWTEERCARWWEEHAPGASGSTRIATSTPADEREVPSEAPEDGASPATPSVPARSRPETAAAPEPGFFRRRAERARRDRENDAD